MIFTRTKLARYLVLAALTLIALDSLAELSIEDAWIAEAPPVSKVQAGYMRLKNTGLVEVTIHSIDTPQFGRIEFHRTVQDGDIARMERQPELTIPAGGELELSPGGYHLMLFDPTRRLRAGDRVALRLIKADSSEMQFEAEVRKMMHDDHEHHHHHHH